MSPDPSPSRFRRLLTSVRQTLGGYFAAGLLVIVPISVTAWVIGWAVQRLDNAILPHVLRLVGLEQAPRIPFVGAVFTVLVILLLGVIARHFFGMELVRLGERLLARVPIARSIYGGVKQLLETVLLSNPNVQFRRVVLIEYPRKGIYSLAFTTGTARGIVQEETPETVVNCFVPTTPNPTSGFYLLVPESEIHAVDLSVEDAFKLIMSGGLVTPEGAVSRTVRPAVRPGAAALPPSSPTLPEEAS
jgi:uncharacterized membrane protein